MDQKEEKANTPNNEDNTTWWTQTEPTNPAMPSKRNTHQHFVPQ